MFPGALILPIEMDAYNDSGYNVGGTGSPEDLFCETGGAKHHRGVAQRARSALWNLDREPLAGRAVRTGRCTDDTRPTGPLLVLMQTFDSAVSADSGDLWADLTLGTNTYNPLDTSARRDGHHQIDDRT